MIAAVSTPAGRGGIGIVRICGPDALRASAEFFKLKYKGPVKPYTFRYGFIFDGGLLIDEALLSYMKAPHSYTTLDTVEINCHGGYAVVQKVLSLAVKAGARLAEPGEFTKLAFLNGRIDLSQAEAVMDIISAESDYALISAAKQLSGSIKDKVSSLRAEILDAQAVLEVSIDYPEYEDADRADVIQRISEVSAKLANMAVMANLGGALASGVKTAIVGRPNTGKSSLLNALLDCDRAIVTEIPGTTRDVLSEKLHVGPLVLNLMDTAGIRQSGDVIERLGVERALACADEADLIIWVLDASCEMDNDDFSVWEVIRGRSNAIGALNKSDLPPVLRKQAIMDMFGVPFFNVSAKNSQGLDGVKAHIINMFSAGDIEPGDLLTAERHKQAAERAAAFLKSAAEAAVAGVSDDLISIDLTEAISALGEITGENAGSDLVDRIFSSFCVGK
ncbi:MAG: tRNA uridine-5-carboxymethylaminomethyl(34) synthesis GTPase MnmE [Clostridiales bacterium]|jgi:tRNA modification GTPase|nr:tRNA uridine-5-carboxymethylaminomethyl(34) synthesis GTPase MnmE [Clostridiales bacterium]